MFTYYPRFFSGWKCQIFHHSQPLEEGKGKIRKRRLQFLSCLAIKHLQGLGQTISSFLAAVFVSKASSPRSVSSKITASPVLPPHMPQPLSTSLGPGRASPLQLPTVWFLGCRVRLTWGQQPSAPLTYQLVWLWTSYLTFLCLNVLICKNTCNTHLPRLLGGLSNNAPTEASLVRGSQRVPS